MRFGESQANTAIEQHAQTARARLVAQRAVLNTREKTKASQTWAKWSPMIVFGAIAIVGVIAMAVKSRKRGAR